MSSPSDKRCPFCELPAEDRTWSGELVFAFRDRYPVSPGHTLIVPERHVATWFDATREEQRALLLSGGVEPGGDVPLGHDEGVAGGDGVAVAEREHELAGPGAVLGRELAERAALVAGGRHRGRG